MSAPAPNRPEPDGRRRRPPPPARRAAPPGPAPLSARLRDPLTWAFVLLGAWLGRASSTATNDFGQIIDIGMVLGTALLLALWYRRRVRGTLEQRRLDRRAEEARRGARPDGEDAPPD